MKKEEAIIYLQQLYPNGGHCWLDEQRMEAIGMAVKALQEEPTAKEYLCIKDFYPYEKGKVYKSIDGGFPANAKEYFKLIEEPISEDTMTISKEWFEHCKKSWYNEGYIDGEYNRDRQFEDSVSEDLEDAAIEICSKVLKGETTNFDGYEYVVLSDAEECFKAGAKWKAEQFEKERLNQCDTLTKEQAKIEQDFVVNFIKKNNCTPTFIDAIEYGKKLKLKDEK